MKKALLIILCLFVTSFCFAGKFEKEAEYSAKETDKILNISEDSNIKLKRMIDYFNEENKKLEEQKQENDKSLCQSVNLVTGSIFLTVGIWGLTISQPYGTITGLVLTWNGIVRIIKAIKNENIICPKCDGRAEIKG